MDIPSPGIDRCLSDQREEPSSIFWAFQVLRQYLVPFLCGIIATQSYFILARRKVRSCRVQKLLNKRKQYIPNRLILVRHGQSEGNIDPNLYADTPDSQLHLTDLGWRQARAAGRYIKERFIRGESVRFIVSPYVRTMETMEGLMYSLDLDKHDVQWVEEPRIREQDFGNFQDPALMPKLKKERRKYGSFYYRFPHGESSSDVYDRVSSFLESLWRMFETRPADNYVLVTHGLAIRVFWMRFFKRTVDEFEQLDNLRNCEFLVLENNGEGKFYLKAACDLEYDQEKTIIGVRESSQLRRHPGYQECFSRTYRTNSVWEVEQLLKQSLQEEEERAHRKLPLVRETPSTLDEDQLAASVAAALVATDPTPATPRESEGSLSPTDSSTRGSPLATRSASSRAFDHLRGSEPWDAQAWDKQETTSGRPLTPPLSPVAWSVEEDDLISPQ